VFEAEAEVEGKAGIGEDIAYAEADGGAGEFLVHFGTIGVIDDIAVCVPPGDVGGAEAVAREGFEVEAGAAVIQGVPVGYEEGKEDHVGLSR